MLLITGSRGQLGSELKKLLSDAIFTDKYELDITDAEKVQKFIKIHNIDTIINCAAYTKVDKAEDEPEIAKKVNAIGPENLAKSGAKIIHISTDYVFDGNGHKPYEPEDKTNPISVYGRSKLAGEQAILENSDSAIIIRTAWLYSSYGVNFVNTIAKIGAEKEKIRVVFDQIGSPTYAADLAKCIVQLIPQFKSGFKKVYHFTNEGVCSWYDLAEKIIKILGLSCEVEAISSSEYPTKATRPFYSVLSKEKIKRDFGVKIRHWEEGLRECLKQF